MLFIDPVQVLLGTIVLGVAFGLLFFAIFKLVARSLTNWYKQTFITNK